MRQVVVVLVMALLGKDGDFEALQGVTTAGVCLWMYVGRGTSHRSGPITHRCIRQGQAAGELRHLLAQDRGVAAGSTQQGRLPSQAALLGSQLLATALGCLQGGLPAAQHQSSRSMQGYTHHSTNP